MCCWFVSCHKFTNWNNHYPLQEHVSGGISVLDEALGQVNNLHDQLEGLLEQLEKMRVRLKGHEPPHVMTIDVEKQIKELMVSSLWDEVFFFWSGVLVQYSQSLTKG